VRRRDGLAAAVMLGFAAVALRESAKLPFGTIHRPGEGFFPWWLAVTLAGLAALLLGRAVLGRPEPRAAGPGRRVGRVLALLVLLGGYAVALEPAGYLICTFVLVLCALAPTAGRRVLPAVALAAAAAAGSYLLFAVWLQVPLPPGPFGR